jgi:hypothetical protein
VSDLLIEMLLTTTIDSNKSGCWILALCEMLGMETCLFLEKEFLFCIPFEVIELCDRFVYASFFADYST